MTNYTVITCRGIGERRDLKMTDNLTREPWPGAGSIVTFELPEWGAEFVTGTANYDRIRGTAVAALVALIRRTPSPILLFGYSAGAHLIHEAILRLSTVDRAKLVEVVLVADPLTPRFDHRNIMIGRPRGGYGILGSVPVWMPPGCRITWVSHTLDVICHAPDRSPIRGIADVLTSISPADGGHDLYEKLRTGKGQPIDLDPVSLWNAAVDLDGYIRRGDHVTPYPAVLVKLGREIRERLPR